MGSSQINPGDMFRPNFDHLILWCKVVHVGFGALQYCWDPKESINGKKINLVGDGVGEYIYSRDP